MDNPETIPQWAARLRWTEETDKEQLAEQIALNPEGWKAAVEFLCRPDLDILPLGRNDITPDGTTFANIQEYTTKLAGEYEAHRAYIDIQYVVSGKEDILAAPLSDALDCTMEYNPSKDCVLFSSASNVTVIPAESGCATALFPSDAHLPGMTRQGCEPGAVRKIVVKVPYLKKS